MGLVNLLSAYTPNLATAKQKKLINTNILRIFTLLPKIINYLNIMFLDKIDINLNNIFFLDFF